MTMAIKLDRDPLVTLEQQWVEATVAVARAQSEYLDLQRSADTDDRMEARAWLRLWKAERHKREVLAALDALEH